MSTNENEAVFDILTVREKLEYLFTVFERQYKELYVVGGAVRDLLPLLPHPLVQCIGHRS